ncbi:hypothetical protein K4F52_007416 [Lecanicillium sp. MT-2017a]|nr:hypothetical protein K4F52_007416 [Lecanicillium sp. MT-2017a]
MAELAASSSRELHQSPDGPVTPDSRRRSSNDTGESSAAGSQRGASGIAANPTPDTTDDSLLLHHSPAMADQGQRLERTRRKQRDRPPGSFLLPESSGVRRAQSQRQLARRNPDDLAARSGPTRSNTLRERAMRVVSDPSARKTSQPTPGKSNEADLDSSPSSQHDPASMGRPSTSAADVDSAQIVNMALNLSETRRIASRRNVSRATPPRLAPLPDSSGGSDLRQQLKQQRRTSRNQSPRPSPGLPQRSSSGIQTGSPLQSSFDMGHDGQYRYHFSPSTLARAQKAKDRLELMAQYRRLLDVLPPLKPVYMRSVPNSPPGSPAVNAKTFTWNSAAVYAQPLGRKYNPLQYIRNRKVRARERKVIDGDRQGFGEIESVRLWVDKICQNSISQPQADEDCPCMIAFPGAEDGAYGNADSAQKGAARLRRPRLDWFIEPCDMVADAYWLEQDHNKELIEDREWRKIFPRTSDLSRPMSRHAEDAKNGIVPYSPDATDRYHSISEGAAARLPADADHAHGSTIERAKEKLHHMADVHNWHMSADHGHHITRSKKDSASEYSDSENELRNRTVRASTLPVKKSDTLHNQASDITSDVSKNKGLLLEHLVPPSMFTPERNPPSKPTSRFQSRRGSLIDTSDSDRKATLERMRKGSPSRFRRGRLSVDGPNHPGPGSVDNDSSLPTSPEMRPTRKNTLEPSSGSDLPAPWSRPGSPTRANPVLATSTGDGGRASVRASIDVPQGESMRPPKQDQTQIPEVPEGQHYLDINATTSSLPETSKGHRRTGSLRQRADDVGLRGIFKGPRIDTVFRDGVSKIGGIMRKKDGSGESQDIDSTDESESERVRGRRRTTLSRQTSKREQEPEREDEAKEPSHFLGSMPEFHHVNSSMRGSQGDEPSRVSTWGGPTVRSTESSQVDLLKQPAIDPRSVSSSLSPPQNNRGRMGDSDVSEADSAKGRGFDTVRANDKRLNEAVAEGDTDEKERTKSRQWSIADRSSRHLEQSQVSRRELARMRALILSSGIKATEINRRAQEKHRPFSPEDSLERYRRAAAIDWEGIAKICPDQKQLRHQETALSQMYPLAAHTLAGSIHTFGQRWQASADKLTNITGPGLQKHIGGVRSRVADDLSEMTRRAADEADETSRNLALDQPLKVKHVIDMIEKMLRKRRRRLRWVRRGMWLTVEWLLVGFMWYVWFVVMILRIFLGVGRGVVNGVKWILWLS